MTFSRFYRIFSARANIFGSIFWQIFTFRKSAGTNRKIFSIPAYSDGFRSLKKSLQVSINQFINLLTLVVRNCTFREIAPAAKSDKFGSASKYFPTLFSICKRLEHIELQVLRETYKRFTAGRRSGRCPPSILARPFYPVGIFEGTGFT